MVVILGQQYNVREKPTVILYTYIYITNRHAEPPDIVKHKTLQYVVKTLVIIYDNSAIEPCLKKNQNVPRPSEHPPVRGGEMSKRLGWIKGCKYKTSS